MSAAQKHGQRRARRSPGTRNSSSLFRRARALMPGGVSSPVRSFASVGGEPFFVASARGSRVRDADGRSYVDFVGSYGPHLFGHGPAFVQRALGRALRRGTSYGAPTELEVRLAEKVVRMVPSIEMVRFVSSGTEATMSAARLARGATGRQRLIKADGGYHGHGDAFLVAAGSGLATLGIAGSPGVPEALAALTTVVPYNDVAALEAVFRRFPGEIAAVFLEPVSANMGLVRPRAGYLQAVREVTAREGAVLVFDEVISGFRLGPGGAQELYDVVPDLTTLGKILGGGLPVGAYGGRRDLMEKMAPVGPIYQAGTLSGNPLAMAAGLAMLDEIARRPPYADLEKKGALLEGLLRAEIGTRGLEGRLCLTRLGSLLTLFFTAGPVNDFADAKRSDTARYATFFHAMRERGIFLPPAQFEAWFVSTAHAEGELRRAARMAGESLAAAFA
ncbi:MAG TPA: glutamate-1-semialdehyde 2,1-aminomutase [Thermoanaerobaculia bacterium]|nr:glutamate-1-semialdehyde 2,1-aminomutase [Thermoanaerobaculia bacterium]